MSIGLDLLNPGDIRKNINNHWKGQIWPGLSAEFCQFDTMEHGIRAIAELLLNGQVLAEPPRRTLREVAEHYAPPSENDTQAYITTLADRTGYDPDATLDFTREDDLLAVVAAIIDAEQGAEAYQVSHEQITAGVGMALAALGPTT